MHQLLRTTARPQRRTTMHNLLRTLAGVAVGIVLRTGIAAAERHDSFASRSRLPESRSGLGVYIHQLQIRATLIGENTVFASNIRISPR
jgi:hypothetical protein